MTNFSKQRNPVGRAEPSGSRSRVGAEVRGQVNPVSSLNTHRVVVLTEPGPAMWAELAELRQHGVEIEVVK